MSDPVDPREALRALQEEAIALSREARRLEQAALHLERVVHSFVRAQDEGRCPDAGPMLLVAGRASAQVTGVWGAWVGIEAALAGLRFALEPAPPSPPPRWAWRGPRPQVRPEPSMGPVAKSATERS